MQLFRLTKIKGSDPFILQVDALFSSHNIEHLYPHEVPVALAEFKQVFKPAGFATVAARRRERPYYDLWALATVAPMAEAELRQLAAAHFPG